MYVFESAGKANINWWKNFRLVSLLDKLKCNICFKFTNWCIDPFFNVPGNFVRKNELEVGDCIFLYEDESKNLVSFLLFSFTIKNLLQIKKWYVENWPSPFSIMRTISFGEWNGDESRQNEKVALNRQLGLCTLRVFETITLVVGRSCNSLSIFLTKTNWNWSLGMFYIEFRSSVLLVSKWPGKPWPVTYKFRSKGGGKKEFPSLDQENTSVEFS